MDTNAVFLVFFGVFQVNSYRLLQVENGSNESNVNVLIDKSVTKNTLNNSARKKFPNVKIENSDDDIDNIIILLKTNNSKKGWNSFENLKAKVVNFFKTFVDDSVKYRSEKRVNTVKPEKVHLRSGKSSTVYEINTNTIIDTFQRLLTSKKLRRYADNLANKAAIIYRSMQEEMENDLEK